jgi:hypothetical protein
MRHGIRRRSLPPKSLLLRAKVLIELLRCICRLLAHIDRSHFDRRFRGEADMHSGVASTNSVEFDPGCVKTPCFM